MRAVWMLLALSLACGDKEPKESAQAPSSEHIAAASTKRVERNNEASPFPGIREAEAALQVLRAALASDDKGALATAIRLPQGYSEGEIRYFLSEIRGDGFLSVEVVDDYASKPFGSASKRLGAKAAKIATQLNADLADLYAFGDGSNALVLHWDGEELRFAALQKSPDE